MSYILDALKKAERERRVAKIPTLDTVHGSSPEKRRPSWVWVGGAVVLAGVALGLFWTLRPEPREERPPRSVSAPATPVPAPSESVPAAAPTGKSAPPQGIGAATAPSGPAPVSVQCSPPDPSHAAAMSRRIA